MVIHINSPTIQAKQKKKKQPSFKSFLQTYDCFLPTDLAELRK